MVSAPAAGALLVTVTGHDRPGVTSSLFDALTGIDATVVDVEQVVIRGRLVLGVLLRDRPGARAEGAAGAARPR